MKAEIISVGTEILLGEILDTNTQYVSARLPAIGPTSTSTPQSAITSSAWRTRRDRSAA